MGSKEMELFNVNIDESIAKEIEIKDKKKIDEKETYRMMTTSKLYKFDAKLLNKDINDENQNKYYSFQIRRHINLIRMQLENKKHPLNIILKKFSEFYILFI